MAASVTAPHAAAWDLRLGHRAGPLGPVTAPSGDSPSGVPVQVELYVQGVWQDITHYVMVRDGHQRITITHGQPDETSQTNAGRCSFQLNNRDGRFSPKNPNGPYYGSLGRNQPIRFSVQSGNSKSYRFWGEVPAWPQKWDITGTDVWVEAEAAGVLRRLGQGSAPAGSALYLSLTSGGLTNPVVAYWPCEDDATATSIASGISGSPPMAIAGNPTLATFTSFPGSSALPNMGTASFSGAVLGYPPSIATIVRFLLAVPGSGATNGQILCSFGTTGSIPLWEIYYSSASGGFVGLRGRNGAGSIVTDSGTGAGFTVNGSLTQVVAELDQNGPDIGWNISVSDPTQTTFEGSFGTVTSSTVGTVNTVVVAPQQGLSGTAIGHVHVQTSSNVPVNYFDLLNAMNAYGGEAAGERIRRLAGVAGVGFENIGFTMLTAAMGNQASSTILNLIQECVTADIGILYESTTQLGIGYRSRQSLENQPPAVSLSYPSFNLSEIPEPIDDDRFTRNYVTVARTNGSSARATLLTGALSVLPPPNGVGKYPDAKTINIQSDNTLADQAGWRLHLGTVNEARFPVIAVNLAHATFTNNPALRQQVLAVRPGDRVAVTSPPSWVGPDDISQIVLGYTEVLDQFQHRISFNCTPESPDRVATADDLVFGRADTDGSTLALDAQATDTTLTVATTNPNSPLWTTNAGDFPFDVSIGGERITVTNITGSTSPQSFTVTRSVNGVAKPQPAGSDVRLFQPAIATF